jgi:hypothetical protein
MRKKRIILESLGQWFSTTVLGALSSVPQGFDEKNGYIK